MAAVLTAHVISACGQFKTPQTPKKILDSILGVRRQTITEAREFRLNLLRQREAAKGEQGTLSEANP